MCGSMPSQDYGDSNREHDVTQMSSDSYSYNANWWDTIPPYNNSAGYNPALQQFGGIQSRPTNFGGIQSRPTLRRDTIRPTTFGGIQSRPTQTNQQERKTGYTDGLHISCQMVTKLF